MAKRLTADELFREFATTDSPFEKWRLFSHITNEATFIFLPNHLQKNLCNLQFGIFEELRSSDTEKVKAAQALMKWLLSHQTIVREHYESASPAAVYRVLKSMTPEQIEQVTEVNRNLFLVFNPSLLTFKKKIFINNFLFWRK